MRGDLIFVFNFSPNKSFPDYGFLAPEGEYEIILDTDAPEFGGRGNIDSSIHHFTTDNSPLPSNTIESIAINDLSGEVFIGTSKGIVSYMSDATKPSEKLENDNIHAYPNPVTSTYNGKISIVGLTMDCNVKIVDAAGYLVNEGTSNGGMYTWNGRDKRGEKVTSGVYYVLTYDEEGN
jgi:hypothetical protein